MATVNFVKYDSQNKTALYNVTRYVERKDKTVLDDETQLVSGQNCSPRTAYREFLATRELNDKDSPVWFYHYTQSFSPDENITPQQVHELAKEFATKAWPKSEVLISTHIDVKHIHTHFIVNAVCFETGLMLRQGPNSLQRLRKLSDELCMKHGFSVLPPSPKRGNGMSAREYRAAEKGQSWKMQLAWVIDDCMKRSRTKEDFIRNMEERGYAVFWEDDHQYITYTCPNTMKARDIKLHEQKYRKEVMEREFRIRQQIIMGRTETAQSAETCTGTDTGGNSNTVSTAGAGASRGDQLDDAGIYGAYREPTENVGGAKRMADRVPPQAVREAGSVCDAGADGRTAEGGEASGADNRTGWEAEREILFSAQNQTAQAAPVSSGMGLADSSYGGDGAGYGSVASGLVQVGRRLEQSQSAELVMDATTQHYHTDSKALRKEREKKIALGHKADDHEDEQTYTWQQTM